MYTGMHQAGVIVIMSGIIVFLLLVFIAGNMATTYNFMNITS
jgi:uncharacterized integral membrane protein